MSSVITDVFGSLSFSNVASVQLKHILELLALYDVCFTSDDISGMVVVVPTTPVGSHCTCQREMWLGSKFVVLGHIATE